MTTFSILDGSHAQASGGGPPEPTCHVALLVTQCRTCRKTVVDLLGWTGYVTRDRWTRPETVQRLYPRRSGRPPVPPEVSASVREWYEEAAAAESASPRAGLALARVCLQVALRDRGIVEARLEVVAGALRRGQVDDADRALQAGLAQGAGGLAEIGEAQDQARHCQAMEEGFVSGSPG